MLSHACTCLHTHTHTCACKPVRLHLDTRTGGRKGACFVYYIYYIIIYILYNYSFIQYVQICNFAFCFCLSLKTVISANDFPCRSGLGLQSVAKFVACARSKLSCASMNQRCNHRSCCSCVETSYSSSRWPSCWGQCHTDMNQWNTPNAIVLDWVWKLNTSLEDLAIRLRLDS